MNEWAEQTTKMLTEMAEPIVEKLGAELIDLKFGAIKNTRHIQLIVDAVGGVSISTCAKVSKNLSRVLNEEDFNAGNFKIDVSSPGIARPLVDADDFRRKAGKRVSVMHKDGRYESPINGIIVAMDDGVLSLDIGSDKISIEMTNIDQGKLEVGFGMSKE